MTWNVRPLMEFPRRSTAMSDKMFVPGLSPTCACQSGTSMKVTSSLLLFSRILSTVTGAVPTRVITLLTVVAGGGVTAYQTAQTVPAGASANDQLKGVSYVNAVSGNTLVNGNLYVNGATNFVSGTSNIAANATSNSVLAGPTQNTVGAIGLVAKGDVGTNGVVAQEAQASVTLNNGLGQTHGVQVYEDRTVISGGIHSSVMTLNDNGVCAV